MAPTLTGLSVVVVILPLLQLVGPTHVNVLGRDSAELARMMSLSVMYYWIQALAIIALVVFWERRDLGSIGFKPIGRIDAMWAAAGVIASLLLFGTVFVFLPASLQSEIRQLGRERLVTIAAIPLPVRVAALFTAAITEEILYRGYAIERLEELTGSTTIGASIALVVFVLLHAQGWGLIGPIGAAPVAVVLVWLYLKRRNLPACMLMHFLQDAPGILLAPLLAAHT